MIKIRKNSLVTVLVSVMVLIVSMFLITIGIFYYKVYRNHLYNELHSLNTVLADQASKGLALPLWNFDRKQILQVTESVMLDESIFAINIWQINPDKDILSLTRDDNWKPVTTTVKPYSGTLFSERHSIKVNEETIGWVKVFLTPRFIEAQLRRVLITTILIFTALAVLLILTLYFLLWNIVLKPIKLLEQFALVVSQSKSYESVNLTKPFIGELELLRISISNMIILLESRYEVLQQEIKRTKDSENQFRILIRSIPDLIWLKDQHGGYLACNQSFENFFGAMETDIIGKTDYDFVDKELADSFRDYDQKVMAGGVTSVNEELVTFASDNHHAILETIKVPMKDVEGNLVGVLGISRDVTEKKKIENELQNHRTNLEALVSERTNELASANEKLTIANAELFTKREKLQTAIDELHAIQKQLIHSEKMASVGVLSAGIAHEINNPLNFIQGGLLGIKEYFETNLQGHTEEVELFITAINIGIQRASAIVSSLGHYSRKDELPQNQCDIHEIIDNCLIMLQSKIRGKIEVSKNYTEKYSKVFGSEGKLHQAFLNIISNAEQAIEKTGNIDIDSDVIKDKLILTISDSGHGISQDNLQKIFDPFFSTKDAGKGTGLGLSITYNIIQEHNGSISYKSKENFGTIVTIELPIIKI